MMNEQQMTLNRAISCIVNDFNNKKVMHIQPIHKVSLNRLILEIENLSKNVEENYPIFLKMFTQLFLMYIEKYSDPKTANFNILLDSESLFENQIEILTDKLNIKEIENCFDAGGVGYPKGFLELANEPKSDEREKKRMEILKRILEDEKFDLLNRWGQDEVKKSIISSMKNYINNAR